MCGERGSDHELRWNGRPVRRALVVASVPEFFELFLGPHIEMLAQLGLEVRVACSEQPSVVDPDDVDLVSFTRTASDVRSHGRALNELRRLYQSLLGDDDALLLHVHTPIAAALARLAIPRSMRDRVCVVYVAHGFHFLPGERNAYALIERALARRTDLIVVMNAADLESAQALGRPATSIPGIGCQRLHLDEPDASRRRELAVVGVLEPRKRPMVALEAMGHLDDDYRLTYYGDGPLEDELRQRAHELGVTERVTFAGWTDDLAAAYAASGCLVFPSSQEGLPMAVVEAVGAGLPVVAFPIRGVVDILDGLAAWHRVDATDPATIAAAIDAASASELDIAGSHSRARRYSVANAVAVHRSAIFDLLGAPTT